MGAERRHLLEQIGEAAVVQLYADGFQALTLRDKTLVWHLYQAALAGRDIYYDQRYAHNLQLRAVLEGILTHARALPEDVEREIRRYTKLFWLNSGPYNGLTSRKSLLRIDADAWAGAVEAAAAGGAPLPLQDGETPRVLAHRFAPILFDATFDPVLTSKSPGPGRDILQASANNLYVGVSMQDLESFQERYGLNSRLV